MYRFAYEVIDGKGGSATATDSLTVNPVNDAPVAADDAVTVLDDNSIVIDMFNGDTDPDDDTLTVTGFTDLTNASGRLERDGNQITYSPNENFVGIDSLNYDITDGKGGFDAGTITETVQGVNDASNLTTGAAFEVVEGADAVVFTPAAEDVDGDTLTFSLGAGADGFAINSATCAVSLDGAAPAQRTIDEIVSDGVLTASLGVVIDVLGDRDGDGVADRDDNASTWPSPASAAATTGTAT